MKLHNEDCIEQMQKMIDEGVQVDSVVTDPPYELGFMGKSWDSTGIAFQKETWELALQLLKPGGHLLAFGGSRTYHRMAVAIEDAGFEIRDQIMWLYGSGFPKSLNIGKAIDEMQKSIADAPQAIAVAQKAVDNPRRRVASMLLHLPIQLSECQFKFVNLIAACFVYARGLAGWANKQS